MVSSIRTGRGPHRLAPPSPLRPWLIAFTVLGWLASVVSLYFYDLARPDRWGSDRFWGVRQGFRVESAYLQVAFWVAVAAVAFGLLSLVVESLARRQERRALAWSVVALMLTSVVALVVSAASL